ncbi:MAG: 1-(5-phosphoribosyl)-5-[(5-phosphoribosylamino)methylideneamino]imidazole-4-carboxamide isomerase [Solirubrobacteraceae bacterium]|jgi:phosphoribosylformimino-5-aminoimidazole carboxamide ribotide isomerase
MILLPAIDIFDGKAVRLERGDFAAKKVYDADPLDAAKRWVQAGARALHVVDLDGARTGAPANLVHVARIAQAVSVPLQLGGGLRSVQSVAAAIDAGVARVVLGTAAFCDVDFLDQVVADHGDRVVVSVDGRDGLLAASGWTEQTQIPVTSVLERLAGRGVRRFIFSSIERDGMLSGPDLDGIRQVAAAVRGTFVYSGGIASLQDLEELVSLRQVNLTGVIVGTAMYERRFELSEAQAVLSKVT